MAGLRSGGSYHTASASRPVLRGDAILRTSFRRQHYQHKIAEYGLAPVDRRALQPCRNLPTGRNGPLKSEKPGPERLNDQRLAFPCLARGRDYTNDDIHDSLKNTLTSGSE